MTSNQAPSVATAPKAPRAAPQTAPGERTVRPWSGVDERQLFRVGPVGVEVGSQDTPSGFAAGLQHRRTCPVAKDRRDISAAGAEIKAHRVYFCPDDEDIFIHARFDELIRDGKGVDESGALVSDIQRPHLLFGDAELALEQHPASGKVVVRAEGSEDDEIQLFFLDTSPGDGDFSRFSPHGGGSFFVALSIVALDDACAFLYPGVGGVHNFFQVKVGDDAFGDVVPHSGNSRIEHVIWFCR